MDVKDRRPCPPGAGEPQPPPPAAAGAPGLDALLDALPPAAAVERRPVARLAPGRGGPSAAAERFVVSRRKLAAALGPAAAGDADLLNHAADRVAARLLPGPFPAAVPVRAPVLLPLPLRPHAVRAPRPGLIGVLPLVAAACAPLLAERRAELAALGWRLGVGGLDAAALRFVDLAALGAAVDLLLVRWSPALARRRAADALRGADPQALVLTGCGGADALEWGRSAGLLLFSGPAAEAALAGEGAAP